MLSLCSGLHWGRGKMPSFMMEFNTVNLELYSKALSFSVVLNNWGLVWCHTPLSCKCKASQGYREEPS